MLRTFIFFVLAAIAAAGLAGCATPGSPLPPSLELPKPPDDLRATRQGNMVTLTWTQPTQTTDKTRVRNIREIYVCRTPKPDLTAPPAPPKVCGEEGGQIRDQIAAITFENVPRDSGQTPASICESQPPRQLPTVLLLQTSSGKLTGVLCDRLSLDLERQLPAGAADYAIKVMNENYRDAGYSNPARVPLAPTPAPPGDLRVQPGRQGILISWTPAAVSEATGVSVAGYRLERTRIEQDKDKKNNDSELLMIAADSPSSGHFLDTTFEWGKPYSYRIAPVVRVQSPGRETLAEVQGAWSQKIEITPQDVFPPAQPAGVQAVYTEAGNQRYIDLTWVPNPEPDLAGYFIYRRSGDSQPVRLNRELVKTPSFRDTDIQPGATYFYSVSAVDVRGNESQRSEEAKESTPR